MNQDFRKAARGRRRAGEDSDRMFRSTFIEQSREVRIWILRFD